MTRISNALLRIRLDDPPDHVFSVIEDTRLSTDKIVWVVFFHAARLNLLRRPRQTVKMSLMGNCGMWREMRVRVDVLREVEVAVWNFLVDSIFKRRRLIRIGWRSLTWLLLFTAAVIIFVLRFLLRLPRPFPLHSSILKLIWSWWVYGKE